MITFRLYTVDWENFVVKKNLNVERCTKIKHTNVITY